MIEPEWNSTVALTEDPELERLFLDRLRDRPSQIPVRVTDLLDLRRAFGRVVTPVPVSAEQEERYVEGRGFHIAAERRLAPPGKIEVHVRRGGVAGQIDLWTDRPVEIKSSANVLTGVESILRRSYIDQLAIYCSLVDLPRGRLIVLQTAGDAAVDVSAYACEFRSMSATKERIMGRAELLREAWKHRSADGLPRCAWQGHGCEFEAQGVCACTGIEPEAPPLVASDDMTVEREDSEIDRLRSTLLPLSRPAPRGAERFRDLLYPRRAYFERMEPLERPRPAVTESAAVEEPTYLKLRGVLEEGPIGDLYHVLPEGGVPNEAVLVYLGDPILLRVSRAWRVPSPENLLRDHPHYMLDLGLRAAAIGRSMGWLVLCYERQSEWSDRIKIYRVHFPKITPFARIFRGRSLGLDRALLESDPRLLPACPAWMVEDCPYIERCGCGESSRPDAARLHR